MQKKDLEAIENLSLSGKPLIFIDSARNDLSSRYSYLFFNPNEELEATTFSDVDKLLNDVDNYENQLWLCGYLSYEAAYSLEERLFKLQQEKKRGFPLAWFGLFENPWVFDHKDNQWNRPLPEVDKKVFTDEKQLKQFEIRHLLSKNDFEDNIKIIKKYIKQGETYQVNFTYDVAVNSTHSPFALYRKIRENQRTTYCSFIQNQHGVIASFSPELFFKKCGQLIEVKPMKGTAPRGMGTKEDEQRKQFLQSDTKNRAENLMIVDLLRNDLGKICEAGSVTTKRLFDVESHPTVHQMTSTITGVLPEKTSFSTIIKSLFPCGSVTGAPKIRTMEIIHELEQGERGVYCGAIGFSSPLGNMAFSVPIRTLQKSHHDSTWRYRVGSGIIWDSDPSGEWEECLQKTRFLKISMPSFQIVETMLFDGEFHLKNEHINRIVDSAHYFNFPLEKDKIEHYLNDVNKGCPSNERSKVRVLLDNVGGLTHEIAPLSQSTMITNVLKISSHRLDPTNPFLYHKTTHRPWYKKAMEAITQGLCYDTLFFNTQDEITECAINSIFLEVGGTLFTPPVTCGLLPGTLRAFLISANRCKERVLYKKDLVEADAIFCGNSVRGLKRVQLEKELK